MKSCKKLEKLFCLAGMKYLPDVFLSYKIGM